MNESQVAENGHGGPVRMGCDKGHRKSGRSKATDKASSGEEIISFLRDLAVIVAGFLGIVALLRLLVAAPAS